MKKVYIKDPTYGAEVFVLVGASDADIKRTMAKIAPKTKEEPTFDGVGCAWEFNKADGADGNTFMVAIRRSNLMTPYGISILAHELLHVTHQLFDNVGMRLNDETAEAYCYFFDALLRDVLKALNK